LGRRSSGASTEAEAAGVEMARDGLKPDAEIVGRRGVRDVNVL